MSLTRHAWTAALAVALVGCSTEDTPEVVDTPEAADAVAVDLGDGVDGELLPPAEPGRRDRRRMDVDQLDASIQLVTGGLYWREGSTNLFESLADTLGKPDYQNTTAEDLSPSLLFQKFLGDAANSVCGELAEVDPARADGERALFVHATPTQTLEADYDAIEANLQHLLLRYHGRRLGAGDEQLNSWRWLFETSTHVSGDPASGWRAVCVGLITHPDFYTY